MKIILRCISIVLTVFFLIFFTSPKNVFAQKKSRKIVLVIDAGHGGRDPGKPKGKQKLHEKELTLIIAKKFGGYVKKYLGDRVKIYYTRTTDKFVTLGKRSRFANSKKADFFISIHCNSNKIKSIHGAEVHIHNHSTRTSKEWAKQLVYQFEKRAGRTCRGIVSSGDRGHNLFVLKKTNMPAVLVETGYMSNPKEEKYLNSKYGQTIIASALYRAFREFLKKKYPKRNFKNRIVAEDENKPENKKEEKVKKKIKEKIVVKKKKYKPTYRVQIVASVKKLSLKDKKFRRLKMKIDERFFPKSTFKYKYTIGKTNSFNKANKLLKKIKRRGIKDAFIVSDNK